MKKVKKLKKKPAKKKPAKTKSKRRAIPNSRALVTVTYNDIVKPETHKGELGLLASYFPKKLLQFIIQPVPQKYIMKREGSGKQMFNYVPGWYAKKCANYAFGFNHSFEIKKKEISGLSAIVEGRLIIKDPKTGREILFKDDIGGHPIRFLKDRAKTPENAVDIVNDYKSAATDCLKRCMAQMGFFSNVYGVNEAKQDGADFIDSEGPSRPKAPDTALTGNNRSQGQNFAYEAKAEPLVDREVDYKKALDNFLTKRGANTEAKKLAFIAKYTFLRPSDYKGILPNSAKSILTQLQKKAK